MSDYEGRRLVDTGAAAVPVGRKPATIRKWIERGHLERRGRDGRRGLVDLDAVLDVDAAIRNGEPPRERAVAGRF